MVELKGVLPSLDIYMEDLGGESTVFARPEIHGENSKDQNSHKHPLQSEDVPYLQPLKPPPVGTHAWIVWDAP